MKRLFEGYSESPPVAIVMMGNFLSTDMGTKHMSALQIHFKELANIISQFDSLLNETEFVFVPGANDSCLGNILPR